MTIAQYDSRQPIAMNTSHPRLGQRKLGIVVSAPVRHTDLGTTAFVDVTRETALLSSTALATTCLASRVATVVRTATEATITELEAAITELTEHRDRLRIALDVLDQRTWATTIPGADYRT